MKWIMSKNLPRKLDMGWTDIQCVETLQQSAPASDLIALVCVGSVRVKENTDKYEN